MKRAFMTVVALVCLGACASPRPNSLRAVVPQATDSYFLSSANALRGTALGEAHARNVIIFIGDGMGVSTVTAARIFAGQREGRDGESHVLAMDTFPHVALSRTYSHDMQVSDSAATATALLAGVKTHQGVIGLTSAATPRVCDPSGAHRAASIFELAETHGLRTGVVSTARLTHATPAAAYAHAGNRDWENDVVTARSGGEVCPDIARQLVEWPVGDGLEIALGGGRANFLPNTQSDPEDQILRGARGDGRDFTQEWARTSGRVYVWNAQQLQNAPVEAKVLGLFSPSHMAYENDRKKDAAGEPSLAEMTATAIRRLSRGSKGFVLLVEGGRIDHAHHEGKAGQALSETVAFDDAVRIALELTRRDDTLILVTADHSHVFSIAGYPQRGNPILGLAGTASGPARAADGLPYTTLGYMNGPGSIFATPSAPLEARSPRARPDISNEDTSDANYRVQALVPLSGETHAGEDVALYAWGPMDAAVAGTVEQNVAFHIMARALGFSW